MITSYPPKNEYNEKLWIEAGQALPFSRDKVMFKVREKGVIYPHNTIINRYSAVFNRFIITKEFSDDEMLKYIYQPKRFCSDYYGTPELWGELLYLNGMVSQMEFNKTRIKVYARVVLDAIEELRAVYRNELNENEEEVGSD